MSHVMKCPKCSHEFRSSATSEPHKIVAFLRENGPARTCEIQRGLGMTNGRANALIRRAFEYGLIKRISRGVPIEEGDR